MKLFKKKKKKVPDVRHAPPTVAFTHFCGSRLSVLNLCSQHTQGRSFRAKLRGLTWTVPFAD